ncbi:MAG: non-canonical purine NTP pyrophosphatase [Candidatus Thermoplasmatota archaeon]
MRLTFVTSNKGKLHEAKAALSPLGIDIVGSDLKPIEIQGESLEEISRAKCEVLIGRLEPPFMVDDAGLFVHALRDFPGVFSAHALKTIGVPGILKLMEGVEDRSAHFEAVVTYYDGNTTHSFLGRCGGTLTTAAASGGHGFGFDPIFVPKRGVWGVHPPESSGLREWDDQTFAQIPAEVKNHISHRGQALAWLVAHLGGR